ncbi:hypothetical protein [Paraburkholderia sp. HP33-1]|uniref:hypothetical protein n=1 Tax=Paraburkholderia sp. HP33-1 TaxID=2883243 RepID=UPI001F421494|nr:hypothetical protein [Paraburkholderia sp. HP33-1]
MITLDDKQKARAIRELENYLSGAPNPQTGKTPVAECLELDENRKEIIAALLLPVLEKFLDGSMPLASFKTEIDRTNKRNIFWGFKGIKGQMFFNLLYNTCVDEAELTAELKSALPVPTDETVAKSRIRNFASYVRRIGDDFVTNGGSKHGRPKVSSIPFFLSYFWQILAPDRWPIYYTNSVQVLSDLNLYRPSDDLGDAYVDYVELHVEFRDLFQLQTGTPFTFYDVEHVWWYAKKPGDTPATTIATGDGIEQKHSATPVVEDDRTLSLQLPDSYVPPIISIIPRLALNDPLLERAAADSGTSIARALEKSVHAAFTVLGYDTQLLGQGQGRIQDGLAVSADHSYAILWDAKARQNGYTMGTDDRSIREYITTQSRQLKRHRHLRNLYYVLISSFFQDDFDDLIRGLKMETDISEVRLVNAEAIVAMIDAKLRDPNQLSLGPDGMQRLFCKSGILTADDVREELQ